MPHFLHYLVSTSRSRQFSAMLILKRLPGEQAGEQRRLGPSVAPANGIPMTRNGDSGSTHEANPQISGSLPSISACIIMRPEVVDYILHGISCQKKFARPRQMRLGTTRDLDLRQTHIIMRCFRPLPFLDHFGRTIFSYFGHFRPESPWRNYAFRSAQSG